MGGGNGVGGGGGGGFGGGSQSANASNNGQGGFGLGQGANKWGGMDSSGEGGSWGGGLAGSAGGTTAVESETPNELGYTAGDYDRALTSFSAPVGDYSGPLGLNPSVGQSQVDGGIMTGGPMNGWGTLATGLGYAIRGVAPATMALSIGNLALGATNSMGVTDTGAIASPRSVMGSIADATGVTGLLGKIGGETPATSAASYASMMAKNDVNPYSGQNAAPAAPGAHESQQASISMPGAANGRAMASNEPTRDPGILAAITGLPAAVFKSPYAAKRTTPELNQGLLQSGLWSNSRA